MVGLSLRVSPGWLLLIKGIRTFSLTRSGPIYIASTDCSDPIADSYTGVGTILSLVNISSNDHEFKSRIKVVYPPNSHNFAELSDSAIMQVCDMRIRTSVGDVMLQFQIDDYGVVSGGEIINITLPNYFTILKDAGVNGAVPYYYDQLAEAMFERHAEWARLLKWLEILHRETFNGVPKIPANSYYVYLNMMQWATSNAKYDYNLTHTGVTSVAAINIHYILNNFDPNTGFSIR